MIRASEKNGISNNFECSLISLSVAAVSLFILEFSAGRATYGFISPAAAILSVRFMEIIAMSIILSLFKKRGFQRLGISLDSEREKPLIKGIISGLKISAYLAAGVSVTAILLNIFTAISPSDIIKSPLPKERSGLIIFLTAGCIVSPIAEELFFRGFVYSFLRKYGLTVALLGSSTLFTILHYKTGGRFPLVPLAGSIIFGLAFESSRNIAAPVVIHILGNTAIFMISLMP